MTDLTFHERLQELGRAEDWEGALTLLRTKVFVSEQEGKSLRWEIKHWRDKAEACEREIAAAQADRRAVIEECIADLEATLNATAYPVFGRSGVQWSIDTLRQKAGIERALAQPEQGGGDT